MSRLFVNDVDDQTYRTSKGVLIYLVVQSPEFGQIFLRPSDVTFAEADYERHGFVIEVDDAMLAFRRGVGPDPTATKSQPD